jgi:glycosyltransferase involved in cell wall biosynthesis
MIAAWSLLALNRNLQPDVLIVGTDPICSPLIAFFWKLLRPRVRLVHWCFDLYPDAAIADGLLPEESLVGELLKKLLRRAYKRFNLIVDIGSCMRARFKKYRAGVPAETIAPWALVETERPAPIPAEERRELFGDARLGLMYSGNFGRAHSWQGIPELAHALQEAGARVVLAVRGNAVAQLRKAVEGAGAPIDFAEFTSAERLEARLSAADIHIVTLREEWTGTVVPSKFFGALAIGRPVLFVGSTDAAIARWIEQLAVGWVLNPEEVEPLAIELAKWSQCPESKVRLFEHCHSVYQSEFARARALDRWDFLLRALL